MKRFAALAFIFLLSAQCIFKLTIITYFEANRDYIAEVLCVNKEKPITMCNGQCFLDRNLSLADDDTPEQGTTPTKLSVETSLFIGNNFKLNLERNYLELETSGKPTPLYNFYSLTNFFHPPC